MSTAGVAMHHLVVPDGDTEWMADAACAELDPRRGDALFFPERGDSTFEAKQLCRGCPVREACLDYALATGETHGIWGGLSVRDRRVEARRRRLRQSQP